MKKTAITLLALASISTGILCAQEEQNTTILRAPIAERPLAEEQIIIMKNTVDEGSDYREQKNEQREPVHQADKHKLGLHAGKKGAKQEFFWKKLPSSSFHWFACCNEDGSIIEIEDGSRWKLAPGYRISNWRAGDSIVITLNRSWFSDLSYYIVNKNTGAYIPAELILGPIAYGPLSHWVVGLDYTQGKVFLEDGTTWKISSTDTPLFNDWQVNDTVIIGQNDSWFSAFETILINVNMNSYIRAQKY
jgi:hypothetical protein